MLQVWECYIGLCQWVVSHVSQLDFGYSRIMMVIRTPAYFENRVFFVYRTAQYGTPSNMGVKAWVRVILKSY